MSKRIILAVGVSLFLSFGMVARAQAQSDPKPQLKPVQHCVVHIWPLQHGEKSSKMSQPICFDNFSDAIYATTKGTVRLSHTIRPEQVTEAMLSPARPAGETVIGIDYSSANMQGSSLTWTVSNIYGCTDGSRYQASSMPAGWDNAVSSATAYAGCNWRHWENTNFLGSRIVCTCGTMGVMDKATSSEQWGQSV